MKQITLTCKVITPLFMGGTEQQAELRTQSFNGVFRYWFRLLGGSFEDEKRLFGWGGEEAKKGIVNVRIENKRFQTFQFQRKDSGYDYLGFSLALNKRIGVKEDEGFKVSFLFHPTSTEDDIKKFLCVVWCAFYLGNFGSRSRRGFGSITIENIDGDVPQNFDLKFKIDQNTKDWLKNQLQYIKSLNYWRARNDIPYIFENLEIYQFSQPLSDYIQLLNKMGEEYKNFRRTLKGDMWEKRIWFGLPIMSQQVFPIFDHEQGRRASLLAFKIIKSDNNFEGFILLFKPNDAHNFKFLPDGARIKFSNQPISINPNWWQVLNDFIIDKDKIYP